jgi:hypothetical protein
MRSSVKEKRINPDVIETSWVPAGDESEHAAVK